MINTPLAASSLVMDNNKTTAIDKKLDEEHINWKLILGHYNDKVVINTLKQTTQYFA